jgi:hypothetical protein
MQTLFSSMIVFPGELTSFVGFRCSATSMVRPIKEAQVTGEEDDLESLIKVSSTRGIFDGC